MDELHAFRAEVEAFLAERDLSPTAFGLAVVNDRNFVSQLNAGREPRFSSVAKVRAFMLAERQRRKAADREASAA